MLKTNHPRIAHIVKDEKFTNSAVDQWEEVYPGSNEYYLPSFKKGMKYVDKRYVTIISNRSYREIIDLTDEMLSSYGDLLPEGIRL